MVYRILRRQNVEADRVTGLVVRGQALVVLIDNMALFLHAHYNLEQRLLDLLLRDQLLVAACRKQRCLIEQVFEVCTSETGSRLGNFRELDIRVELLVAGMYLEDSLTALDIRCADIDLTVETARTQQRVIQNILAVGGCDDDNALVCTKAVHLNEQLVERLLALVMAAAETCAALTAYRVDLIDEHDSRCVLLGLLEQVAHTRCADTDVQLNEVRTRNRQERYARLACNRTRDQGLTGARRADQQHALRNTRADLHELLRILEELDNFLQLGLFLIRACHIIEGDLALIVLRQLCTGLAKLHRTCSAAGLLVHHKAPERDQQHDQDHIRQELCPPRNGRRAIIDLGQRAIPHLLLNSLTQIIIEHASVVAQIVSVRLVFLFQMHSQRGVVHVVLVNIAIHKVVVDLIIGQRFCLLCLADHIADARQQAHQYDQVKAEAFHFAFQIGLTPLP